MIEKSIKYRPIHRLLVANRGEIAVRIIRTAREMGITTIGIVTSSEPHTAADEDILLEGDTVAETYLNVEAIIKAALAKKADAIHPGYGFLSENPDFAEATNQAGLIFVGPTAEVIRKLGDKTNSGRDIQKEARPTLSCFDKSCSWWRRQRNDNGYFSY